MSQARYANEMTDKTKQMIRKWVVKDGRERTAQFICRSLLGPRCTIQQAREFVSKAMN